MSAGMPPRLEMIADPYRIQTELLRQHREVQQFVGPELLRGRLVSEFDHAEPSIDWPDTRSGRRRSAARHACARCRRSAGDLIKNLRRLDLGIARLARADQGPVTLIDQHEVQKIAVLAGDFQRRHRQRELVHDFRRGTFDGRSPDQRRHGDHGRLGPHQEISQPRDRQNRRDAQVGIRRTEHDALQVGPLEGRAHLVRQGRRALGAVAESAHRRGAAMLHEVLLERQLAELRQYRGGGRLIAHRQELRPHAEAPRELAGDRRERHALRLQLAPIEVQGDVAIAQLEPGIDLELTPLRLHPPGFVRPAPSLLRVGDAGERIQHGVQVRADRQSPMLEIVAGIDDDGKRTGCENLLQSVRQLRAADAPA